MRRLGQTKKTRLFVQQQLDLPGRYADGAGLNLPAVFVHPETGGHVGGLGRSGV